MPEQKRIRILLAKPGLDALHDRGYYVVGRALREAGMEVIMAGKYLTPHQIAQAAIQEDVDLIGISLLSGAPLPIMTNLVDKIKALGGENIPIIFGGIIPEKEIPALKKLGILGLFGPGTPTARIVEFIQEHAGTTKAYN